MCPLEVQQPRQDDWRPRFAATALDLDLHVHKELQPTSSRAIRFWINRAILESRYRTSFSRTKFFLDWFEILTFKSRSARCALAKSSLISRSLSFALMLA